jgi:hypothetical protein
MPDDNRKVYAVSRTDGFAGVDYSLDEIRKFQEEDPDLELVLQFLRTNQSPSEEKLFYYLPASWEYSAEYLLHPRRTSLYSTIAS